MVRPRTLTKFILHCKPRAKGYDPSRIQHHIQPKTRLADNTKLRTPKLQLPIEILFEKFNWNTAITI